MYSKYSYKKYKSSLSFLKNFFEYELSINSNIPNVNLESCYELVSIIIEEESYDKSKNTGYMDISTYESGRKLFLLLKDLFKLKSNDKLFYLIERLFDRYFKDGYSKLPTEDSVDIIEKRRLISDTSFVTNPIKETPENAELLMELEKEFNVDISTETILSNVNVSFWGEMNSDQQAHLLHILSKLYFIKNGYRLDINDLASYYHITTEVPTPVEVY